MNNWFNSFTANTTKGIFSFLILIAFIIGFFIKLIPIETFIGIGTFVLTSFYKEQESLRLTDQLNSAKEELKTLRTK